MRSLIGLSMFVVCALASGTAAAQDVDSLKKELEQMRKQFDEMKQGYEKAINQLGDRIQNLESKPAQPVATPSPPTPAAPGAVAAEPPPSTPLDIRDLARPRQPFSLYQNRGPGQLLFDIGIAGDFIGNLTQHNVQQAQGGTFPGLENYFFPREVELSLFGQIDPYARAEVRFESEQEERGGEIGVKLAEANLTLMTLPFNTQAKLGLMRNRFGLINQLHDHDLPFIDRPDVYVQFFGQEGLVEKGVEFTWVPPLPFFVELLGGVFNGDNETAFGYSNIKNPLVTGRVRTFFELGDFGALQLGMSVANGLQSGNLRNTILGWDAKYKYVPDGWQHPFLTVAGEALYQMRQLAVESDEEGAPSSEGEPEQHRLVCLRRGAAVPLRLLEPPGRRVPLRLDRVCRRRSGHQWAVEPYLAYMPSEFLRFRVGYKHTEGNTPGCCTLTGVGSARIKDELLFQATFILGAHPAHPF